jgi:hypothetical protein
MSYIGSTPTTQSFIAGTDSFNGTGSATNFTLSRFVNSTNDIQVVVNNVVQYPPNYSVSGNTLTISPAPSAGTNNVYVRYLSTTLQSITIPGGSAVQGNFGLSGNLQFLGSAQRITGDFSNGTLANRALFQTSTANEATSIATIPSGTGSAGNFRVFGGTDVNNTNFADFVLSNAAGAVLIRSDKNGTGTYLPMTFYTGGSERMRIATDGQRSTNVVSTVGTSYSALYPAYDCRAWVNFDGTGTVAIRASGNVSSITDNGTGDYTVNFTNAMPDANYCGTVGFGDDSGSTGSGAWSTRVGTTRTVSAFRVRGSRPDNGALADSSDTNVAVFR